MRYCAIYGYVKVKYMPTANSRQFQGFTELDSLAHILPLHWAEGLEHSPYFGDSNHAELVAFASKCGLADYYRVAEVAA